MASDSGALGILDAATAVVEAPAVDTTEVGTEVETPTEGAESELNEDGTEKTEEQKTEAGKNQTPEQKAAAEKVLPAKVRNALKEMRDASPENAGVVKELHGAYERWNAAKAIFPKGISEMKDAAGFLKELGGREGYAGMQQTVESIKESDSLLYAGDPKLMENIVADLKSEGRIDALAKLAPAFLSSLKENDSAGYYKSFAPHFLSGLKESGVHTAINEIHRALAAGDTDTAKGLVQGMATWYNDLQKKEAASKAEASPEQKAFQKEKSDWETTKATERKTEIAKIADTHNNKTLGTALRTYLQTPFFKGLGRPALVALGNQIKSDLYAALKSDKVYKSSMDGLWNAKSGADKDKISNLHQSTVDAKLAERIVRNAVQAMYPGHAKGGAAAGRIAAVTTKKAAETKANATAVATGKPVYVPQKPKWDAIDWDKDPKQLLYIGGKAYLKGSGRLVTWRRS